MFHSLHSVTSKLYLKMEIAAFLLITVSFLKSVHYTEQDIDLKMCS
jgi:hypothetical protein